MSLPVKIIQCSKPKTASTLLVNILAGLIEPDKPIFHTCQMLNPGGMVSKTHVICIDHWIKKYKNQYNIIFVCSNRGPKRIDIRYTCYPNVIIFDYDELLETPENSLDAIINLVHDRLVNMIPEECLDRPLNKESALKRIIEMNILCEEIADKPHSYYDEFYHIHGSHRSKNDINN